MEVLDEPLYANYLRVTGAERPYRDQLLAQSVRFYILFKVLEYIFQD